MVDFEGSELSVGDEVVVIHSPKGFRNARSLYRAKIKRITPKSVYVMLPDWSYRTKKDTEKLYEYAKSSHYIFKVKENL